MNAYTYDHTDFFCFIYSLCMFGGFICMCLDVFRYPINRDIADDFLTQTWFIVLLGSIIAIIVFLFGVLVLIKRYQFIKQTSLGSLHGKFAFKRMCVCGKFVFQRQKKSSINFNYFYCVKENFIGYT